MVHITGMIYPFIQQKEGIFFCTEKKSRVTKKSICKDVPIGRFFWFIDNPLELIKLKKQLEV